MLAKERASEIYSIEAYYLSKCMCELPVQMVMPAIFLLLLWPLVGLPFAILPAVYAITIVMAWVSASISQMFMCLIFDGDLVMKILIVVVSPPSFACVSACVTSTSLMITTTALPRLRSSYTV